MKELEFLPADFLRARFQRRIGFIRSWLLLALGTAMVLWSFQMGAWVQESRAELMALQSSDVAIDADVGKVRLLQTEAETYDRRIEMLRLLKPGITVADACVALGDLMPDGVVLEDVLMTHPEKAGRDQATLHLVGRGDSEAAVSRALRAMETSPIFGRVTLIEAKPLAPAEGAGRSFTVEADVMAPAGKE